MKPNQESKSVGASVNQRKAHVSNQLNLLMDKIQKSSSNSHVQNLLPELESLKDIERQESESESRRATENARLEYKINELDKLLQHVDDPGWVADVLDHSLSELNRNLNHAKEGLAIKHTTVLLLKRQLDWMPSQGELIQYERRLSELYTLIQGKLRQTRQCYATYNALLEIKDLMLKETSLLNSISSQFHNTISSPTGEAQLVGSMQGISQGSQQKLKKIQLDLQAGQKVHANLKEKYAAALLEQRLCKSLLQAFQAECAKNEQLRGLAS